jgi:hypothetical protein
VTFTVGPKATDFYVGLLKELSWVVEGEVPGEKLDPPTRSLSLVGRRSSNLVQERA